MDLYKFIIISLYIAKVVHTKSRRKYISSSSDESIENLLYYKDCQRRKNEPATTSEPKPSPEPLHSQNACPNPRMCCSLSCDNECGSNMMLARQDMGMQPIMPMPQSPRKLRMPLQPQILQRSRAMKKKRLQPGDLIPPIGGGRRDFGFTKEKIKTLISKDGDIRKILKDLVRVTMQKVDLLDMLKTKKGLFSNIRGDDVGGNRIDEDQGHGDVAEYNNNSHNRDDYDDEEEDDDELE